VAWHGMAWYSMAWHVSVHETAVWAWLCVADMQLFAYLSRVMQTAEAHALITCRFSTRSIAFSCIISIKYT
jgi:hypothetical protein